MLRALSTIIVVAGITAAVAYVAAIAVRQGATPVASVPKKDQVFRDLGKDDLAWLAAQRGKIEALIEGNPDAHAKYRTNPGKLGIIQALLDAKTFRPDRTFELQGLGIILGDALATHLGMKWKMVEDEHGVSPCLILEGTSVVLFPQTMISRRRERGEEVDVFALFDGTVAKVEKLRSKGW